MSQSKQARKIQGIKCDILAAIPEFDNAEYTQLSMDRRAGGETVELLREQLFKGIISYHQTRYGKCYILSYMALDGIDHDIFSCKEYGSKRYAKAVCLAYQAQIARVIQHENKHEFDE